MTAGTHVTTGAFRALKWIAVMLWLVAAFWAAAGLVLPVSSSVFLSSIILLVLAIVAAITLEHWLNLLPGMLALGMLSAGYAVATGRFGSNGANYISRSSAVFILLALLVGTVASLAYLKRKVGIGERSAAALFICLFIWAMSHSDFAVLGTALASLSLLLGLRPAALRH